MTDNEINTYRFSSGQEPSDELLSLLMKEAVDDAMKRQADASKAVRERVQRERRELRERWQSRIKEAMK